MYKVQKVGLLNIIDQIKVSNILFDCGKDMAKKYNLHHWDNSHIKSYVIVILCILRNTVFLVTEKERPVATFQVKKKEKTIHFEKLACSPLFAEKGIGSFCMSYIEGIAKDAACERIVMEVYSLSYHAIEFYLHKEYNVYGETKTLKYSELKMEKRL